MIIDVLQEQDLFNKDFMNNLVNEVVSFSIPIDIKKALSSEDNREEYLQKYGDDFYLQPTEKKFPVKNPKTGEFDCRLIYAARLRALQNGNDEIAKKAEELFYSNNCSKRINININDHNESYDLVELINILELEF